MQENTEENKIDNNKVDDLYNIWLGRRFLVKTFEDIEKDESLERSIQEMRQVLYEE